MGALHAGHLSLVKAARRKCDRVILTLFVNPTQFGRNEDLTKYPRTPARDLTLARQVGVDLVFMPRVADIYPKDFSSYVEVVGSTQGLCGATRPGHFRGVTTIVAKLFLLTQPDYAFFGKKDYQQYTVVKNMARDLNFPIKVVGMPIVREQDGLAMSSRNVYLSPDERRRALRLSAGLFAIKKRARSSRLSLAEEKRRLRQFILGAQPRQIDYIAFVHANTLLPVSTHIPHKTLVAVAVKIGKTRLIDNVVV